MQKVNLLYIPQFSVSAFSPEQVIFSPKQFLTKFLKQKKKTKHQHCKAVLKKKKKSSLKK